MKKVDAEDLTVAKWARDKMMRKEKYVAKNDSVTRAAVKRAFKYDYRVKPFDIDVKAEDGEVSLSGLVTNLKAKKSAGKVADNIVGVWKVNNNIRVKPDKVSTNKELKSRILKAFARDQYLKHYLINVECQEGKLFLQGSVEDYFEKQRAEEVASKIEGVTTIENNLEIKTQVNLPYTTFYGPYPLPGVNIAQEDNAIQRAIENELWWSPYVNEDDVKVKVENQVVTLKGTVETEREEKFAIRNAYEGGAKEVISELEVSYNKKEK